MKAAEEDKHPRKARRISRACDYCHHRSIRCRPSPEGEGGRCQNCVDFEQPCTYDRPVKRRGAKVRLRSASATTRDGTQHAPPSSTGSWGSITANNAQVTSPVDPKPLLNQLNINGNGSNEWRAPLVASQAVVMDLVEIYFEVIYPMYLSLRLPHTFLAYQSQASLFFIAPPFYAQYPEESSAPTAFCLPPLWQYVHWHLPGRVTDRFSPVGGILLN